MSRRGFTNCNSSKDADNMVDILHRIGDHHDAAPSLLEPRVARSFHELFPNSEVTVLPTARHYVQVDKREQVANLILGSGASIG